MAPHIGPLRRGKAFRALTLEAARPSAPGPRGEGREFAGVGAEYDARHRHWPALFRCWFQTVADVIPEFSPEEVAQIIQELWVPNDVRTLLHVSPPEEMSEPAARMYDALKQKECKLQLSAWRRHKGQSAMCLQDVGGLMDQAIGGRIRTWEMANLRIPDSLILDSDVVIFSARLQRLKKNDWVNIMRRNGNTPLEQIHTGMKKFLTDRWVRFGLCAPYISSLAVAGLIKDRSLPDAVRRAEFMLDHPLSASEGELELIEGQPFMEKALADLANDLNMWVANRRPLSAPGLTFLNAEGQPHRQEMAQWAWFRGP